MSPKLRRIAHLDLPGGGQVRVHGTTAYVGHMDPPHGTTILDVSDPAKPSVLSTLSLPDGYSHSHKVRVAGDVMIVNVEQAKRHLMRRIRSALEKGADTSSFKPADIETARREYGDGGFRVYDISDKRRPRLLTHVRTHGFGVHRFDMDSRYAYISTEMEGYVGNILVIYDLARPERPEEVARWWMPGQHVAGGEKPTWPGYKNRLHHALRCGDQLWAAVWHAGLRVIDVSDIRKPRTVGAYDYHPPFPEPTHTVLRVPFPVAGRQVAVGIDEEHDHVPGQLHAGMWIFDVGDLGAIRPLAMFHVSELDSPWSRTGRFGAHQFQEHMSDTLVYATWFSGGLRIVDIADPTAPREVASYIPEPPAGFPSPQSNDVDVDERGLVYLLDRNRGLDILEYAPHG
ncbi:MAG TPA: hypothetical protein VIV54_04610 [Burkholderiales bacterium]